LRRNAHKIARVETFAFGPFELDLRAGELRGEAGNIALEPKVFALVVYLIQRRGELVTREELLEALWRDTNVSDASVTQAVASLRDALGDDARNPRYIATMQRRGYKFVADVIEGGAAKAAYHIVYGLKDFILAPGENIIGRGGDAAVRIASERASRHHARILVSASGAIIEDLGSTNGTIVGGERLDGRRPLQDGDEIVIGDIKLTFHIARPSGTTATVR
jgi:DNA-binding winged helix-turn-helix (wHTH) protein